MIRKYLSSLAWMLLAVLMLGGCGLGARPTDSPVQTPLPAITPTASPTTQPTPTPVLSPSPTRVSLPTLIPTADPTALPDLLQADFSVRQEDGIDSRPLRRVGGWAHGMRSSGYCERGAYQWLDNAHLLLFPLVGETEAMGIAEHTLPVVINLDDGDLWLPMARQAAHVCDLPVWSNALQTLITPGKEATLLSNADGAPKHRYPPGRPLSLSPSEQRLLVGSTRINLNSGQTMDLGAEHERTMRNPAWSSDETRLFDCCFGYADTRHPDQYSFFQIDNLGPAGRGAPTDFVGLRSQWVLSDTRVMVWYDFLTGDGNSVIPLIDPPSQGYRDVSALAGINTDGACYALSIAPTGNHLFTSCRSTLTSRYYKYLINLRTFSTFTLPDELEFHSWSPDGRFALLRKNWDQESGLADYQRFSLTDWSLYPMAETSARAPAWSHRGEHLAFLGEDKHTLIVRDVENWTAKQIPLPQPCGKIVWHPQDNGLVILAEDGSLWLAPDLSGDAVEPLAPSLPDVRDLRWSPDGEHLAFVSGPDVYVVSITETE